MTRDTGTFRADADQRAHRRPKWPWVLLALLVVIVAILVVFFALGWLSVDFSGGDVDIDAPSVDVDTDLPDVDVDPGEAPDIDVEDAPSN
jgi:hypothetical protein